MSASLPAAAGLESAEPWPLGLDSKVNFRALGKQMSPRGLDYGIFVNEGQQF